MAHSAHGFCPQMDKDNFRDQNWVFERQQSQITVGKEEVGGSLVSSAGTEGRDRKDKNSCTRRGRQPGTPALGRQGQKRSKPSSATTVSSIPAWTT